MITGTMAMLVLVLSLLGIVGFAGLLILGVKMWGEERAAKRAAQSQDLELKAPVPAEIASEIEAAPVAETPEPPAPPAPGPAMESLPSELALPASEIAEAISAPEPSQGGATTALPAPASEVPPAPEAEGKGASLRLPFLSRGPAGQEILRVMRDPATGQFSIYVAGKPYANYHDLQNPANEQAFMMAFQLLQAFSENAVVAALPATEAQGEPQTAAPPPPAPVAYRAAELPPPEMPSMRPFQQLRNLRAKQPPATKFVIKSITEQIEDHLQDKIARTPMARRGVHVRADTQGNAIFLLDGKIYLNVEAVPDPEVQRVIRETISEWEKKK